MGSEKNAYVGPYIVTEGIPQKESNAYDAECSQCGNSGDGAFCSDCGTKLTYEKVMTRDWRWNKFEIHDGEDEPALWEPEHVEDINMDNSIVLVPVNNDMWRLQHNLDGLIINESLKAFKERHKKEIELLKQRVEKVHVRFGLVEYWS